MSIQNALNDLQGINNNISGMNSSSTGSNPNVGLSAANMVSMFQTSRDGQDVRNPAVKGLNVPMNGVPLRNNGMGQQDTLLQNGLKRDREAASWCAAGGKDSAGKKQRTDGEASTSDGATTETDKLVLEKGGENDPTAPAPVPASKKGIAFFSDYDVLSGRGGGTNVHPGNRNFRDLINLHRRAYLKARKNDKPAISRAIVRSIRENNGRFLKKDEKAGLWIEIGDDAAREKTSQALRQRAPEMRKLLFDTEREEARSAAEEHLRQQRMIMGMTNSADLVNPGLNQVVNSSAIANMHSNNPMLNPALFASMSNKNATMNGMQNSLSSDQYQRMFSAALLGGGMERFPTTGV